MNWGIIGYGEIAPTFIAALTSLNNETLVGIASASHHEKARQDFQNSEVNIYPSYDQLLLDSNVDIVYICTTNQLHYDNVSRALREGKHVLCEKPMAMNSKALSDLLGIAKSHNKFLMEGMWTRFLPAYRHFIDLLAQNSIGKVNFLRADFGFFSTWGDERRLKNKDLFGGAILDNSDYNLFLCQDVFKVFPVGISAFGKYSNTEVEETCGIMLKYPDGAIAQVFSSFQQQTKQEAYIYGSKGYIFLEEFWRGVKVVLHNEEGDQLWKFPFRKNGFEYQIEEVVKCINSGHIESTIMSHVMSLEMSKIIDIVIDQIAIGRLSQLNFL